jgi:hypothetical protein
MDGLMNHTILALTLALSTTAFAGPRLLEANDVPLREQLTSRLTLLESEPISFRGPRGAFIGGACAITGGGIGLALAYFLMADSHNQTSGELEVLQTLGGMLVGLVGGLAVIAGVILVLAGVIHYFVAKRQESNRASEMSEVRERLEGLDRAQAPAPMTRQMIERRPVPRGFELVSF